MKEHLSINQVNNMIPQGYHIVNRLVQEKEIYIIRKNEEIAVVKIIEAESFDRDKFDRLCMLNHEGIEKIISYNLFENYIVIIKEYVEGKTLFDLVSEKGVISEGRVKEIITDMTFALEYLHTHEKTLVFRDLHPKNVIITTSGKPVLIDIESVKVYKPLKNNDTQVIGVIGFIAPEQYGFGQSSVQSDIYSLGVLGAFMLNGSHPTFEKNQLEVKELQCSKKLKSTIEKMVAFSKSDRPKSMKAVRKLVNKEKGIFGKKVSVMFGAVIIAVGGWIIISSFEDMTRSRQDNIMVDENKQYSSDEVVVEEIVEVDVEEIIEADVDVMIETLTAGSITYPDRSTFNYSLSGEVCIELRTLNGQFLVSGVCNENGIYNLEITEVPDGEYFLRTIKDNRDGFATQPDKKVQVTGGVIQVEEMKIQLKEPQIKGEISKGGVKLQNVDVSVFDVSDNEWVRYLGAMNEDGNYMVGGLEAGEYTLMFRSTDGEMVGFTQVIIGEDLLELDIELD